MSQKTSQVAYQVVVPFHPLLWAGIRRVFIFCEMCFSVRLIFFLCHLVSLERSMQAITISAYWSDGLISLPLCIGFYACRLLLGQCMITAVEIILVIRGKDLPYHRKRFLLTLQTQFTLFTET